MSGIGITVSAFGKKRTALVLGALLAACTFLLTPRVAQAQAFRYSVELDVPEAYRELLQQHLEIFTARENPRMTADQLRLLVQSTPDRIRELLATEGYYSPTIISSLEHRQGAWIARFAITPGEPSIVARVELELHGAIAPAERGAQLAKMRERWLLREGFIFRQEPWEQAKRGALQLLLAEQYPAARIAFSLAKVDPQTRQVRLKVVLDSGPAFTFGTLAVSGLDRYSRSIVDRLNVIAPGSTYSQAKLLQFQARLQDSRYVDSLSALTERTDIERQVTRKYGLGAKRARVVGDTETAFGLQYQTEREEIAGAQGDSRHALVGNYAWTRRKLDNLLYPTDGFVLSAQIGAAAKALLSGQDFVRSHIKATHYRSTGKNGGVVLRGEFGATLARSREGIPSDFLFRAGGDQSVRGYAYQSLGVRSGDAIVGGRYLAVAGAEYVHWLTPDWGAAVFYDAGSASDNLRDFKRGDSVRLQDRIAHTMGLDEFGLSGSGGLESAALTLGKRLSSRAYLTFEQGLAAATNLVKITYSLTPHFSVRAQTGTENAVDAFYTFSFR